MLQLTHELLVNAQGQTILTRAQLWSGLILRVVEQTAFTVGLDRVELLEQGENYYCRQLHFGQYVVRDRVDCVPFESVQFTTQSDGDSPSGRLRIQIVETDELRLRFDYETDFPEASDEEEMNLLEVVKSAYRAADQDVVRVIRELLLSTQH